MSFFTDRFYDYYNSLYLGSSSKSTSRCQQYTIYLKRDEITRQLTAVAPDSQNKERFVLNIDPTISPCKDLSVLPDNVDRFRVIVVSDTHERHAQLDNLPPCHLLIHTGDVLMRSRYYSYSYAYKKYEAFRDWLLCQRAGRSVVVGGNHDCHLETMTASDLAALFPRERGIHYLCNEKIEVDGFGMSLGIFATPYSQGGSENRAFQSSDFRKATIAALNAHCGTIGGEGVGRNSDRLDILVTHGPCHNLRERCRPSLLHVFGHIHAHHGLAYHCDYEGVYSVAAPIMDSRFDPSQLPIVLDFHLLQE